MKKLICILLSSIFALSVIWSAGLCQASEISSEQFGLSEEYTESEPKIESDSCFEKEICQTKIFNYIDRTQFENKNHIARITSLEKLNTYVFANDDGTNTVYMLPENVKYVSNDGSIREKDITLIKKNGKYITSDNDICLSLPEKSEEGIIISFEENEIITKPHTANNFESVFEKDNNTVSYYEVFGEDTCLRYTPTLSGVKEDIILESYKGISEFTFEITTNLEIFEDERGMYFALYEDDETKIYLGGIYTYDAEGKKSYGAIETEKTEGGYLLTVKADKDFLEREDTVYPVTVDPTVTIQNRDGSGNYLIQDAPIFEFYPNTNFRYEIEDICGAKHYSSYGIRRAAIRLTGLEQDTIFGGLSWEDIVSANLYLRSSTDEPARPIRVNKMLGECTWDRTTVKWNNAGTIDEGSTCTGSLAYWQWSAINIKTILQMWKVYGYNSFCLMCRYNGDETTNYVSFTSSEHSNASVRPYFEYTYTRRIEEGTYFINNKATGAFLYCFGVIENDSIRQYTFDDSQYEKWIISRRTDGYYTIQSKVNNYYLGVVSTNDINSDLTLYSAVSNKTLWDISVTSSDAVKIMCKSNISLNYVMNSPNSSYNGVGYLPIKQAVYTDNYDYKDEWEFWLTNPYYINMYIGYYDGDTSMYSIASSVEDAYQESEKLGYSFFEMSKDKLSYLFKNTTVFSSITHGYQSGIRLTNGIYYTVSDIDDFSDSDLNDLKFVYYGACSTGEGESYEDNLVNTTYEKGADFVLGFTDEVFVDETNIWSETLMKDIASGASINYAIADADSIIDFLHDNHEINHELSTRNRYYCGNIYDTPCD